MWFFIARRVLYAVPILFGVSLVVFLLMKMVPGDAADIMVPPEAPREVADMIRARFGLDQPVHIQYLRWLQAMASGDLGTSIFTNQPVAGELFSALVNTLKIALPAVVLGFSLGVLSVHWAYYNGSWLDKLFSAVAITGVSLPHYWVGMVLVAIFAVVLNVLPGQGMGPEGRSPRPGSKSSTSSCRSSRCRSFRWASSAPRAGQRPRDPVDGVRVGTLAAKGLKGRRVLYHIMKNAAPSALASWGCSSAICSAARS